MSAVGAVQLGLDDLGTALIATTFVVVDLETTGLDPEQDRITEIGAVRARGGEVLGELATFVDPGAPIPPAVTALTGIRDADVAGAPPIEGVLPSLLEFLRGGVLVGHNVRFDLGFLRAALERAGRDRLEPIVLDTAVLARRLVRAEVRDCRLATLARHLGSPVAPDHRALTDARATLHVLHALIERSTAHGVVTLEDLAELGRLPAPANRRRASLVADAPSAPGVYRFLDREGRALYVGTASDLSRRLRTYFGQDPRRRVLDLVRATDRVTWTVTATALEASVREVRELHATRPPHNRRSTRPQAVTAVALTREPFPRLAVVRDLDGAHRRVVGPLTSRAAAERVIAALLAVHPLRECRPRLRRRQDHDACVLKDLHRCGAPCDGTQTPEDYERLVLGLEAALDDPAVMLAALAGRMTEEAGRGAFERAAELREAVHALVRALATARRWATLTAVERLVAVAPSADGVEAVELARGRLVASVRLDADAAATPETLTAAVAAGLGRARRTREEERDASGGRVPWLTVPDRAPTREDAEEVALIAAWLERDGVTLLEASDALGSPLAGGRALADALRGARDVDRRVRGDADRLEGRKVRRRAATVG